MYGKLKNVYKVTKPYRLLWFKKPKVVADTSNSNCKKTVDLILDQMGCNNKWKFYINEKEYEQKEFYSIILKDALKYLLEQKEISNLQPLINFSRLDGVE